MTFLHFPTPSCRFFRFYVQFTSVYKYSQENNGLFWEKTTVVFEKTLDYKGQNEMYKLAIKSNISYRIE